MVRPGCINMWTASHNCNLFVNTSGFCCVMSCFKGKTGQLFGCICTLRKGMNMHKCMNNF